MLSPCVTTIAGCLEALQSIQQLIQDLQWPDKDVDCHLQQRCLTICSEQLRYCTSMWVACVEHKSTIHYKHAWPTGQWHSWIWWLAVMQLHTPLKWGYPNKHSVCYALSATFRNRLVLGLNKLYIIHIFSGWKAVTAYWSGIGKPTHSLPLDFEVFC